MPLVLLLAALLYLDQYQNGLLEAEVAALREQARIFANAIAEAAVRERDMDNPTLVPEIARPLLRRLTEPTPNAQARLYAPDGMLVADSRVQEGAQGVVHTEPLPPPVQRGAWLSTIAHMYDWVLSELPHGRAPVVQASGKEAGIDWQPDVKRELRVDSAQNSTEMAPYIRRTAENRLLVTVAEPVERNRHTVGIVLLTREAREVDDSLLAVRVSIMALFGLALGLTVIMSWYLSLTIARPLLRLAVVAENIREARGARPMPAKLLERRDEIGELAVALSDSAKALWARMDAIERFAADVAHEIKNPLSSIRSAIETLSRLDDKVSEARLLSIITDDVHRLDRLISDISDASRVDAELSRVVSEPIDIGAMLGVLAEIDAATRKPGQPVLRLEVPAEQLVVLGVEDRVVQVLRNLIGNAQSFSPRDGTIVLRARETGGMVEVAVEDEGPGIPQARLDNVFDRFYSERPAGEGFGKHSGLGLSISRQIVEALKGRIRAENRRGADGEITGARFVVLLPRA